MASGIKSDAVRQADTAARLGRYFVNSLPEEWMQWQAAYDLDKVQKEQIRKDVRPRDDTGNGEDM